MHAFIANLGPEQTASPFTVTVTLPDGVTAERPFFPETCTEIANGRRVRCTFLDAVARFDSATALIPVRLATTVPINGTLTGGRVEVRSPEDKNRANDERPFEIHVVQDT
ncbi:hypothetical protein HCK01_36735 [Streptomyces sp. AA8]|uniref:hypothetical protein n=1 Tax=Streptomyces telluris TaxID=2720021 RepID=UPI00143C5BB2|nr:hypothetical protein [Streptomyces telluris]NJP82760.1 hypothetical protein [Streptomyces telluris]